MSALPLYHYTNSTGYNAIRSQPVWHFIALKPAGDHPVGAYFTSLPPATKNLAKKLRIPRSKLAYMFIFVDMGDLTALDGDRGDWIFYSPVDYDVNGDRQLGSGPTGLE
jgi:hypothetical protein